MDQGAAVGEGAGEAVELAVQANSAGLECFAAGLAAQAEALLRRAYRLHPQELGILVNLGLALMQQRQVALAERCYRLALRSPERRTRRSAAKNLGFLLLWCGQWQEGWHWHSQRFEGEAFLASQWRGEPLNGQVLTVWNDVGMGDAFQFVRYTLPLVQRGERVQLAVDASQIDLFRNQLAWPLTAVLDRRRVDHRRGPQIPLMSLIPLLDPSTSWGRSFQQPTWRITSVTPPVQARRVGLCWASNPGDRTMHRYKSQPAAALLQQLAPADEAISLQTGEDASHRQLGLEPAQPCWQRTLQQIQSCRRVLSVDTAVAHLAAGAGVPVRLLLGSCEDWRWRQHQPGQPLWYSSLQLQRS